MGRNNRIGFKFMKQTKYPRMGCTYDITQPPVADRDTDFFKEMASKTIEERREYWSKWSEVLETCWRGSYPKEVCIFKRQFMFKGEVI